LKKKYIKPAGFYISHLFALLFWGFLALFLRHLLALLHEVTILLGDLFALLLVLRLALKLIGATLKKNTSAPVQWQLAYSTCLFWNLFALVLAAAILFLAILVHVDGLAYLKK
jgi:hypothetical protein